MTRTSVTILDTYGVVVGSMTSWARLPHDLLGYFLVWPRGRFFSGRVHLTFVLRRIARLRTVARVHHPLAFRAHDRNVEHGHGLHLQSREAQFSEDQVFLGDVDFLRDIALKSFCVFFENTLQLRVLSHDLIKL